MRFITCLGIAILLFACSPKDEQKFRIPAEWEEHEAVWIGWDDSGAKSSTLSNIISHLQTSVKVKMAYSTDSIKHASLLYLDSMGVDTTSIDAHVFKGANEWARDYGAVFAFDSSNHLSILDFNWNAYGSLGWEQEHWPDWVEGKYDSLKYAYQNGDISRIDSLMGVSTQASYHKIDITLEGGSFEYNGNGILIQCEAVTMQRNPEKTKEELESEYRRFGIEKVIWLPNGVIEDEHLSMLIDDKYIVGGTGGHTDEFVRFVGENTILLAWVDESEIDEHPLNKLNYDRMSENLEILKNARNLKGKPFEIIKMPTPRPIETTITLVDAWSPENWENQRISLESLGEGHNLALGDTITGVAAAGYLNFLVTNGMVLVASYDRYGSKDKDDEAEKILQKVFPDRKIVRLDVIKLNGMYGGGGIHCVTMQEPKVK